jgi:hypothetical protein
VSSKHRLRKLLKAECKKLLESWQKGLGTRLLIVDAKELGDKLGYDIESKDGKTGRLRFIEVKGRIDGADSVMITRQEIITSLHEPARYILALVQVGDGFVSAPRYLRGALDTREPPFGHSAIQFKLADLLARAGAPA